MSLIRLAVIARALLWSSGSWIGCYRHRMIARGLPPDLRAEPGNIECIRTVGTKIQRCLRATNTVRLAGGGDLRVSLRAQIHLNVVADFAGTNGSAGFPYVYGLPVDCNISLRIGSSGDRTCSCLARVIFKTTRRVGLHRAPSWVGGQWRHVRTCWG